MPPAVRRDTGAVLREYWLERLRAHTADGWAGVPMAKLPEDLRTYQHLLWEMRADAVVELGVKWGGSLLWFRDQLRLWQTYGRLTRPPIVVGVDLMTAQAETMLDRADPSWRQQITLLEGDISDPRTLERLRTTLPAGARPLIVDDAAHTGEVTRTALDGLADLVPEGGFYVVEDTHVDLAELHPDGPPEISQLGIRTGGMREAISTWLGTPAGAEFAVRGDLELYGITSGPGGFLQRRGSAPTDG